MRLSSGLTFLSARLLVLVACCPLAWAAPVSAKAKRQALLPIAGKVTPAHVTESESGAAVDASKEIVASKKKNSPLRVDDLGGQPCVLTGEVLLPSPKSRLTIQCGPSDKSRKSEAVLELGFDSEGDLRAGHSKFDPPLFRAGARETKQWLPFSLMRVGKSLRSSVADKAVECQVAAAEVLGLSIMLRGDARAAT